MYYCRGWGGNETCPPHVCFGRTMLIMNMKCHVSWCYPIWTQMKNLEVKWLFKSVGVPSQLEKGIIIFILFIVSFGMYVYRPCPKMVVEAWMVENFKIHHKGHKPCANEQVYLFLFTLSFLFLPYTSAYYAKTMKNAKNMLSLIFLGGWALHTTYELTWVS
jgi:hypothetical protein